MACANHPDVDETRACTSCDGRWCEACIVAVGTTAHKACPRCGYAVRAAAPHRSGSAQALDAVRRVVSLEGLTTAAGFAVPAAVAAFVPALLIFWVSAVVGYYFTIIHHVGAGHSGLPGPSDATDDWVETIGFALRGVLCVAVGAAPLLVWVHAHHELPSGGVLLALLLAGQLYMPAALLAVALSNRGLAVLWPVAWVRIVARAPLAYARFVVLWVVSLVMVALIVATTRQLLADVNVLLGNYLAAFVWGLCLFAQAALVGNYLRQTEVMAAACT